MCITVGAIKAQRKSRFTSAIHAALFHKDTQLLQPIKKPHFAIEHSIRYTLHYS